jgi:hypothetical protein
MKQLHISESEGGTSIKKYVGQVLVLTVDCADVNCVDKSLSEGPRDDIT